jgi:hypothetical protein
MGVVTATNQRQGGGSRILLDLLFTLVIPISILSPNLLGSGFSFVDVVFGGNTVLTYVVAALVPVVYTLLDLLINRRLSPIAILAGSSALVGGALAFWYVDGWRFAFKDSLRSALIGVFAVASVFVGYPLFRIFLEVTSVTSKPEERSALSRVLADTTVFRALKQGTLVFALVEFVSAIVNFFVNLRIVTATFGTKDFNAQVAEANAVMRLPGLALSLVGFALAYGLIQKAVGARYGRGASILEPAQLAEKLKADGEPASR